jgi:flagellar biogenesis protein FliO
LTQCQAGLLENTVKAYQILFILWIIVFAFWLVKQFSEHNKRTDR